MIKFEDNHVTVTDNLIISDDDPFVSTMLTDAKTYSIIHERTYYASGLVKHIALHKAVSFWQKVGFGFRLVFWGWK